MSCWEEFFFDLFGTICLGIGVEQVRPAGCAHPRSMRHAMRQVNAPKRTAHIWMCGCTNEFVRTSCSQFLKCIFQRARPYYRAQATEFTGGGDLWCGPRHERSPPAPPPRG